MKTHIIRAATAAAILAATSTATAHPKATTTATPKPLPALPPGLTVGNRQIIRQDGTTPPTVLQLGGFDLSALTTTTQGQVSASKNPLWVESDQSRIVAVCDSTGVLPLDQIGAADETVCVRVHDEQGNVATFAQRVYKTPYGTVESPLVSVRLDSEGNLLPLAVVRLETGTDGSVRVTRDSDFAEPLIVHYRFHRSTDNPRSYQYAQNVVIPAGAASAIVPIQAAKGDMLTLAAGFSYTPAPAEGSDVIEF